MTVSRYLYIIFLNENRLNSPIKKKIVAEWIKRYDLSICCLQEAYFRSKGIHKLRKGWKKMFYVNGNQKKVWGITLISDKLNLKTKTTIKK